jgi:DNA-binding PadR family transcriptional regulator
MARTATAPGKFGGEVILGLLAEEPSGSYQLDRRLAERFGSVGYTNGMAKQTLKRLRKSGLVRTVDADADGELPPGVSRAEAIVYEPTSAGSGHFRRWMWASITAPPVREELHAKIALCQPSDMPRMITLVREAVAVCAGRLQDLNVETQARRKRVDPERWSSRMDVIVTGGDQAWWESRIKWLQRVRIYLEQEWRAYQAGPHSQVA